MLLSDEDLARAIGTRRLIIEPHESPLIQPSSIDVRLDRHLLVWPHGGVIDPACDNPMLPVDMNDFGGTYPLAPAQMVLASTVEHVTLDATLAARVEGKALALDTPVPTPTGWTTMGNLVVGDMVLGADGRPARVVRTSPIFLGQECFKIRFDDRTEVVADADHRWLTWDRAARDAERRNGRARPAVRTTREISKTLTVASGERQHAVQVVRIEGADTALPIDPYVLGAWLGDGTSSSATLTVGEDDQPHFLREFANAGYPLTRRRTVRTLFSFGTKQRTRSAAGRYQDNGSTQCLLRSIGVLGAKHIPAEYLRAPYEARLALLQGLMDTDGSINRRGDQADISLTSQRLASDVAELIASLGIKVWRDERPAMLRGKQCGTAYRSRFRPTLPIFRMPRKTARITTGRAQESELRRRFIRSVEPTPSVPVRCIEVDAPDHLFLVTRAFIPTHNSSLGRLGLAAHVTAGFIDPGFTGHITLELVNHAPRPLLLHAGMRIGQMCVFQLSGPARWPYGTQGVGSRYQGQRGPTASRSHINFRTWPTTEGAAV